MDYSFYLKNNTPNKSKLIKYGFEQRGEDFVYKKNLKTEGLFAIIKVAQNKIEMRVLDSAFNDDFIPFGIKDFQCPEKTEAENILKEIVENCFDNVNVRNMLIEYIKEKYQIDCEYPWEKFSNYCTFKTKNSKKWFALFMNIKQSCIGLDGENVVDVVNIKAKPETILNLVDGKYYFNAYHMNKKNWITILLDKNLDIEKVKNLIDQSHALTEK